MNELSSSPIPPLRLLKMVDRASFKLSFKTVNQADFEQDNRLK